METAKSLGVAWESLNLDSSVFYHDKAISLAKTNNWHQRKAVFFVNRAFPYSNYGKKEACLKSMEEAITAYQEAGDKKGLLLAYFNYGFFAQKFEDFVLAIGTYKKAIELADSLDNLDYQSKALNNLSLIYQNIGAKKSAIEYLLKTLEIREKQNSPELALSYNNLGMAYHNNEQHQEALTYLKLADEQLKKLDNEELFKANQLVNITLAYIALGNQDSAEAYLNKTQLFLLTRDNLFDQVKWLNAKYKYEDKFGSKAEGVKYLQQAIQIFPEDGTLRFKALLNRNLASALLEVNSNLVQAEKYASDALEIAAKIKVLPIQKDALYLLFSINQKLKNLEKSSQYSASYIEILDSLSKIEQQNKVMELQAKYESEKKELQIELLGKENALKEVDLQQTKESEAQQRLIALISIIALIIMAFLAVFLYRLYGEKKQTNEELAIKNAQISAQKEEREILLKEIHHRVKNNLQVISSLLDLQTNNIKDESALIAMEDGQSRVKAMALIHQNLYQNQDIGSVPFEDYTRQLVKQLMAVYTTSNKVEVDIKSENIYFDIDTAIPLGLILNELVSNAFKYAFKEVDQGQLNIQLEKTAEGEYILTVSDNGKGLPENLEMKKVKSLGLRLVNRLSRQLYGSINYTFDGGAKFEVAFKDTNQRKLVQ